MFDINVGGRCNAHDNGSIGQFRRWAIRKRYDIQSSLIVGALTNFPVYIDETVLDPEHFEHTSGSLRASSDYQGATRLSLEIIYWDTTTKKGAIIINIPTISLLTDTSFYLFSGRSGASQPAVGAAYGEYSVWTPSNYIQVYHCNDLGSATSLKQSASASYAGTKRAANEPAASSNVQTSLRSADFDGVDDDVSPGYTSELDSASAFTYSFCVNWDTLNSNKYLMAIYTSNSSRTTISPGSPSTALLARIANGADTWGLTPSGVLSTGSWYHISVRFNGAATGDANRLKIRINNVNQTLTFGSPIPATTYGPTAAALFYGAWKGTADFLDAKMQNIRYATDFKAARYPSAEYNNLFNLTNFIKLNPLIP